MSSGPSWEQARWRDRPHQPHQTYDSPSNSSIEPRLAAPTAIDPASASNVLSNYPPHDLSSRDSKPRVIKTEQRPSLAAGSTTDLYSNASAFYTGPHPGRHSPAPSGNFGPAQLSITSPNHRQTLASNWRSLPTDDHRPATNQSSDGPLTLHIPQSHDLPRITPGFSAAPSEGHRNQRTPSQITPLPSFASFRHHANRPDEPDAKGPEVAPMSSRLPCEPCTKLNPMVRDIAVATAELHEMIQGCNDKAANKTFEANDDAFARLQWILDRLRSAKRDVQDALRKAPTGYGFQQQTPLTGLPSQPGSPSHHLKRQAPWDHDECAVRKQPRSGVSPDRSRHVAHTQASFNDRRGSTDIAIPDLTPPPPPCDSALSSAYPRHDSPSQFSRPLRPLPSPLSLAYPPSVAPSMAAPPGQSVGSPVASYQPSGSVHASSTSSATSAHIADLQHQVTLKSLALQSLQSEYASLLQKLQRERVKSQTIEKKTTVVDQEVNELLGKNEELSEQFKSVETRLEESEKKREEQRAEAAREKEQWSRMLDMSGRLQAKAAEDRQKLIDERDDLLRKVTAHEEENHFRMSRHKEKTLATLEPDSRIANTEESVPNRSEDLASPHADGNGDFTGDVPGLQREIGVLKWRIQILRFSLEQLKEHHEDTRLKTREFLQSSDGISSAIDRALSEHPWITLDAKSPPANGKPLVEVPSMMPRNSSSPKAPRGHSTAHAHSPRPLGMPSAFRPAATSPASLSIIAEAASAGRAMSPGPEELGFQVQPSTSTPNELIKALGPVAAPIPGLPNSGSLPSPRNYLQARIDRDEPGALIPASPSTPSTERTDAWMMPQPRTFRPINEKRPATFAPTRTSDAWTPTFPSIHAGEDATRNRGHVSPYGQRQSPHAINGHTSSLQSSPAPTHASGSPSASSVSGDRGWTELLHPGLEMKVVKTELPQPSQHPFSPPGPLHGFPAMATSQTLATFRQWDPPLDRVEGAAGMPPPPRPSS